MSLPKVDPSTVTIFSTPRGRFADVGGYAVPVEMLSLAAGPDAWLRRVRVKCLVCGQHYQAGALECELCPSCYERAGEENEILDHPTPNPETPCP